MPVRRRGKPKIDIQQYGLQSEATTAVVSGKADAMLADSPVVAYAITQAPQIEQLRGHLRHRPVRDRGSQRRDRLRHSDSGCSQRDDPGRHLHADPGPVGVGNGAISESEVNPSVG